MRLERIVLQGFKSFADKTVFEFGKNFTAVVGPNGSGKSNIADGIRWVLGEQSMKTLRSKSSQDVIFSGSDQLSRLGMAQVELHLDNSDGRLPVEYKEVVITRKIFRSGESEYRLNNSAVRLQDIIMMLAQAKFGQKSYSVIGQGMITHFLNASPQDRKLFFDEATGVREYQIKRDQAINKLIRTEEHLGQAEVLLTEIEPHLKSLTRQVNRLEKRENLETELRDAQVIYYGSLWFDLQQEHAQLIQTLKQHEQEIAGLEEELTVAQTASDAISREASRGERYQVLQKSFNDLLEKKSYVLKEEAVLKGKLEVEHQKQGELSLVWLKRKEDEIVKDIHTHEDHVRLLKEQIQHAENELGRQEQQLQSLQAEFRDEEYAIVQLKEQIERQSHAMTVPEIQSELNEIFSAQEEFLKSLLYTKSLDEFKHLQAEGKKITRTFAEFMDRLNSDQKEAVESIRVEMKQKEQSLQRLVSEREEIQRQVNASRVTIESTKMQSTMLHTQLTRLQTELSSIQSNIDDATAEKDESAQEARTQEYNLALEQFTKEISQIDKQITGIRTEIDQFNQEEEEKKTRLVAIQTQIRTLQRKLTTLRQQLSTVEVNMARIETRQEDVNAEIRRELPEDLHAAVLSYTSAEPVNQHGLQQTIGSLQRQLAVIGSVDAETVQEYEETKKRFEFLEEQTTDLSSSIDSLEQVIDELDKTIHAQFQKNFKIINEGFQKYFKVLFAGGDAKLAVLTEMPDEVDAVNANEAQVTDAQHDMQSGSQNPEAEIQQEKVRELIGKRKKKQKIVSGIEVMASPPGKKITNVAALSGGEKSLISIALLCSIIAHNPSPFIILDEVEAALDEENSEKLAAILKDLSTKTQIIVITHNRVTMRAADMLYGVTIGKEGKSHILSVELEEAEELVQE